MPFNGTANVTFANRRIGNLRIFKFEDANGNQLQDAGEGPVQGVTITVQSPAGTLSTKTTDLNGLAVWNAIPIGAYRVTETLPAGWQATLPLPPLPPAATATVPFNGTANVTFANRRIGNLRIFKFEDANGNLLQDAGEGPVQGVTVTVQAPAGTLSTKTTDLNGLAVWNAIPVGAYRVTETLPAGWQATLPPAATATVPFNATANVTFANQQAANSCIIGRKIDDLHRGLPGWTIHAKPRDAQGPVLTTVTDGRGDFHFTGLQAGWWTVWEEMQPGWAPVTVATFDVPLPPGPSCVEVGFKNRQSCARDPYEPDDTPATATLIMPNGDPQKHTLEAAERSRLGEVRCEGRGHLYLPHRQPAGQHRYLPDVVRHRRQHIARLQRRRHARQQELPDYLACPVDRPVLRARAGLLPDRSARLHGL